MREIKSNDVPSANLEQQITSGNYRHILDLIPCPVAYVDTDLRYQYINSSYERWIGSRASSVIGHSISDLTAEDMADFLKMQVELVASGNSVRFENKVNIRSGLRYLQVSMIPDFDALQKVKGYCVYINDITDNKKAETELRDCIETASMGLHWVDADGIIVWANQAEMNMLGYDREEYIGHHIAEFHADQDVIEDLFSRLCNRETVDGYQATLKCKDGSTRHVSINSSVLWEGDEFIHTRCFTTDITDQKRAEQALKESEARYRELMQLLPAAVYTCDANGRIQLFNQAAVDLWGRRPEPGKDQWCGSWKIFSPIDGEPVPLDSCPMAIALNEGRAVLGEEIIIERPDGTRRDVVPYPRPMFDVAGKLAGAVNMLLDITEQKIAAQNIRESEERFRIIAELVPIIIWMTDEQGACTYVNGQWTKLTGNGESHAHGQGWSDFIHPDEKQNALDGFARSIEENRTYSCKFRYLNASGQYEKYEATVVPRFDKNGELLGYIGTLQNIEQQERVFARLEGQVAEHTEKLQQRDKEYRQTQDQYHKMIAEVRDYAIILLNPDGIIENWNAGAKYIKGYDAEEIVGKSIREFYTKEDRDNNLPEKLLNQALISGRVTHEGWRVKKDGSTFWGSVAMTALHDDNKNVIGFSKVTRDLTARKMAEDALKEKNHQLEQLNHELEKMNQELSAFAYVSSHDLQEPLRKIQTFCSRILDLEEGKFSEKGKDYFDRIQASAKRMRLLIDDLLTYSRASISEGKFVLTDLNTVLQDVRKELNETFDDKCAILESTQLPSLKIIPFQFHQLFVNLFSNALKFSKENILPLITVKADVITSDLLPGGATNNTRGLYHRISVSDNGIGFEPKYNTKIFEVFQRLHNRNEYAGTGVGLAICRKIMQNHGGFITAEGQVDKGATFYIYLPA